MQARDVKQKVIPRTGINSLAGISTKKENIEACE